MQRPNFIRARGRERRRGLFIAALALASVAPGISGGVQFDVDMTSRGYVLQGETRVIGVFNGCRVGASIPLADGRILYCRSYHYYYGNEPEVAIWWNSQLREGLVQVGGEKFDAFVFRPGVEDPGSIETPNPLAAPRSQGPAALPGS